MNRSQIAGGKEILCGRQPVMEALQSARRKIFRLILAEDAGRSQELAPLLQSVKDREIPVLRVGRNQLDRLTEDAHHQGVGLEVSGYPYVDETDLVDFLKERGKEAFVLALDHIQDPQNLGSLLRSAECMGVDAVIIPADRSVSVTPAVVRASSGATEHVRVARVVNLVRMMTTLKEEGIWFYGLEALEGASWSFETDLRGAVGLVIGSEGEGLGRLVRETCDHLVRLPREGRIGSLNAAVAGAMAIYEVCRQRKVTVAKQMLSRPV